MTQIYCECGANLNDEDKHFDELSFYQKIREIWNFWSKHEDHGGYTEMMPIKLKKRKENSYSTVKVDSCDLCNAFQKLHDKIKLKCGQCNEVHKLIEISARGGTQ